MCMRCFFVLMQDQLIPLLPLCQDQSPLHHKSQERSQAQHPVRVQAGRHHAR